ncbi:hypothetical protein MKW98_023625, partial [Papaver atlanticum]
DPQNSSHPLLGFGKFSATVPSRIWNQIGQSQTSSESVICNNLVGSCAINSSRIPFQPPRYAPANVTHERHNFH